MKYGRLKIELDNEKIDVINKAILNENLATDCNFIIKFLKVKMLPKINQYSMDESLVKLEIDNIINEGKSKKSYFDIDFNTPLELLDCNLNDIKIQGNGKVLIEFGY